MADLDPAQYAALKTELISDPKALGLPAMSAQAAADKLNQVGASGETVAVGKVLDAYLVVNATVAADWAALSTAEKQRYQTIVGAGKVDPSNANVVAAFQAMFAAGTTTHTNLLALANRSASRAEKLFGSGVVIQYFDVDRARAA